MMDGKWHHLAGTYDGKFACFYVDGKLKQRHARNKPLSTGPGAVYMGAVGPAVAPKRSSGYAGNITRQLPGAQRLLAEGRRQLIKKFSFMEARAVRCNRAPQIDAQAGDDAWRKAPRAGPFVVSGAGTPVDKPLDTHFRCAYDADNLYLYLRMGTRTRPDASTEWARTKQTGVDLRGTWRLGDRPAVSILVDPAHSHHTVYEFQIDPFGHRCDALYDVRSGKSPQGVAFNSNWRSAVRLGDDSWHAEVAIPWKALGGARPEGHVMGLQVWRTGKGMRPSLWSYAPRWWGVHEPSQAGHMVLGRTEP